MSSISQLTFRKIAKLAMLAPKEVREHVAVLVSAGFLHQQEIPRSADRNSSRSFFLWYVSRTLCYQGLIARFYDTLVNMNIRQKEESLNNRALIRRSERRDVRENLGLLEQGDRDALAELMWRSDSLATAQERIDSDILVLETLPSLL
jgi:DNA-directed RNA polymerase III subunit RPC3